MRPDGSDVRNLTRTCQQSETHPDWSADGARLTYFFFERGTGGIAVIGREGGVGTGVFGGMSVETFPVWSPDGTRIAFSWTPAGIQNDIYTINANGTGLTNLTNTAGTHETGPAWSPDGTRIAFSGFDPSAGSLLYTMDPAGANRVQVTQPAPAGSGGTYDFEPDWSPDGTRLAFVRNTGQPGGPAGIYVVPATGGTPVALVGPLPGPQAGGLGSPSWSPSGTRIAFAGPDGRGVWTMNADGSAQTQINPTRRADPDWGSAQTYGGAPGGCAAQPQPQLTPELGRSVVAKAVRGVVGVRRPGSRRFARLRGEASIPIRSLLDTRRGTVRITAARDSAGNTQSGDFASGVFQVLQSRRRSARGLTELRLKGSSFKRCGRAGKRSQAGAARLSRRTIRRLRARAKGRFRTRGRHSAATVRGTTWTTTDRCDGTLTKVSSGRVVVRDLRRRRNVLVRAGRSYLARAPG